MIKDIETFKHGFKKFIDVYLFNYLTLMFCLTCVLNIAIRKKKIIATRIKTGKIASITQNKGIFFDFLKFKYSYGAIHK